MTRGGQEVPPRIKGKHRGGILFPLIVEIRKRRNAVSLTKRDFTQRGDSKGLIEFSVVPVSLYWCAGMCGPGDESKNQGLGTLLLKRWKESVECFRPSRDFQSAGWWTDL